MKSLIGKRVIVMWTTKAFYAGSDWPSFRVIDADDGGIWCQGVESPNGCPHKGDKVFINESDYHDLIEWKE